MSLPSPGTLLGIPNRFSSWYEGQEEVFRLVLDWYHGNNHRFLGLSISAGAGKSLNAILAAKLLGVRTCILTATKGLQNQYRSDFEQIGVINMVGRNNFNCTLVPGLTADDGPCHEGFSCSFRNSDCPYYQQLARAMSANIVVTNYAYYLAQTRFSTGLGEFGLLVCVPGKTKVTLADGSTLPIKDIVENRRRLLVKSVDLSTGKLVDTCITGWHVVKCKTDLLHISTVIGSFDVTVDHDVWTDHGYVQAGNLRIGDIVYGYSTKSGATNSGEPLGRRKYASRYHRGGKSVSASKPFMETEEFGVCEMASVGRVGKRRAGESGCEEEWSVGDLRIQVPNTSYPGTRAILSTMLPRWEAGRVPRMVGLDWYSRFGMVVHGRRQPEPPQGQCGYIYTLLRRGREPSYCRMASEDLLYRWYCVPRQSWDRVLP